MNVDNLIKQLLKERMVLKSYFPRNRKILGAFNEGLEKAVEIIKQVNGTKRSNAEETLFDLMLRHQKLMSNGNIIITIYTSASGFLWDCCKVDSGTDLGGCNYNGDDEMSGAFTSYLKALEDAITLIEKCPLSTFQKQVSNKKFHWGNYTHYLDQRFRTQSNLKIQ